MPSGEVETACQNARNASTRRFGAFPAMIAELMAPIEIPATCAPAGRQTSDSRCVALQQAYGVCASLRKALPRPTGNRGHFRPRNQMVGPALRPVSWQAAGVTLCYAVADAAVGQWPTNLFIRG
jgi:hypothetical protein